MITREILNTFPQSGSRTERPADEERFFRSPESPLEFTGIAAAMEDGDYRKCILFYREVNVVRLEAFHASLSRPATDSSVKFRLSARPPQGVDNLLCKLAPQARLFALIAGHRLEKLQLGLGPENQP